MKLLITALLIATTLSFTPKDSFASGDTPRETMKIYLKAMVKIKNGDGNTTQNYSTAISTFDLESKTSFNYEIGKKYAEQLINTIDKIKKVDYNSIPNEKVGSQWFFDKRFIGGMQVEISIKEKDKKWYFTQDTFKSLSLYTQELQSKNIVKGVKVLKTFADDLKNKLPVGFSKTTVLLENWQWLGILCILLIAFIIEKVFDLLISFILNHYFKVVSENSDKRLMRALQPLGKIVFLYTTLTLFTFLEFEVGAISVTKRILYILMSFMAMWLGHRVIELLSFYATQKSLETETKFDDILVPLISKTAFVIVYILGAILIANSLTIDVSNIVAGLGIGGLAFAFAAKDTLSNFFGSIMLVLDRPFDIGDIITAGDVTGIVHEVGFRSTRIRTFSDSMITISNGELMSRPIDNMGKRRFRRLSSTLGLEYSTPPEKIESFCEAVRQLIIEHKWTRKDSFHVYFTNFGESTLDISIVVYWKTEDYSRELTEKHRLMIDILRVAREIGVEFAFPTQTVHMFNQTTVSQEEMKDEYLKSGREKAKSILEKPISLKNPRSNSEDENQFGKNDIGL